MSTPPRAYTPQAGHGPADLVGELLSEGRRGAPRHLPGAAEATPPVVAAAARMPAAGWLATGPHGLGTSAARTPRPETVGEAARPDDHSMAPMAIRGPSGLGTPPAGPRGGRYVTAESDPVPAALDPDRAETGVGTVGFGMAAARLAERLNWARAGDLDPAVPHADLDPAYAERPWGDRSATPLYCPITERMNEPLAEEVDRRLATWAEHCGFDTEQVQRIRRNRFGRLAMLAHPDCEDPDRLLIAAKMNAAWWAADDYYADDDTLGAVPELLPPRLVLAMAAMDPLPPAGEFTVGLEEALVAEPVLLSLRSGLDHMARFATPEQIQRTCYATFAMFVSWTAYAAWRHTGQYPPAWKYLAARQHDSFYTSMTLVDVLGGYTLSADLFHEPRVRRAAFQAGTAVVLLNDLYSVAKDMAEERPPCNMVLQVAADRDCSIAEATEITVNLHNDFVRDFQASHRSLQPVISLELQRFLRGLRAWMGGAFEWHDSNPRYRTADRGAGSS